MLHVVTGVHCDSLDARPCSTALCWPLYTLTLACGSYVWNCTLQVVAASSVAECRRACCNQATASREAKSSAGTCVGWTFTAARGATEAVCTVHGSRGVLAVAFGATTSFRAMSVPPSQDFPFSWDHIPIYTHTSNASGLFNPKAIVSKDSAANTSSPHSLPPQTTQPKPS